MQPTESSESTLISAADTLKALIIFARFPDGEDVKANGDTIPECTDCGTGYGWPVAVTTPPDWADSLIENTTTPTIPGSITHFFDLWSDGKHIVMGNVLDTVIVVDSTLVYFDTTYTADEFAGTMAANRRVLQLADPHVDFSVYNHDGDPFVDYIFINWRSTRTFDTSFHSVNGGVSWLIDAGDTLTFDTMKIIRESGATISSTVSFNRGGNNRVIRHRWQYAAHAIHEYGHDLVSLIGHGDAHLRTVSRYGIMQGNTFPGCLMMEGYLRKELGWIDDALEIDPPGGTPFDTTFTLSASYTDLDDTFAILRTSEDTADSSQYFLLEARAQDMEGQAYNTPQPAEEEGCCERTLHVGDGLLITHITENGFPTNGIEVPLIDIEVATGMFDLATDAPDPIKGKDRINSTTFNLGGESGQPEDLFQDGMRTVTSIMAPFTNPNTALYRNDGTANRLWQDQYSGISIYNVAWNAGHDSIRVSVHYDSLASPGKADTLKTDMKWQGLVQVMGDVEVPLGRCLQIAPGAMIVAAANRDARAGGEDTTSVELIVRGSELAEGTGEDDIIFTSSRDNDFVHFGSDDLETEGEVNAPGNRNWYGHRFDVSGCRCTGFGYSAGLGPLSKIQDASIEFCSYGIKIEDFQAPSLVNLSFDDITEDRHIYIDSTDIFIPYGYFTDPAYCDEPVEEGGGEWTLLGETHVVAANATLANQDLDCVGDSGKVDILVDGLLVTSGDSGHQVFFEPDSITPVTQANAGNDWGGIFLSYYSNGSALRFADIGYAANPVFSYYPGDSLWMEDTRIHHFSELGLWLQSSLGHDGPYLTNLLVERGDNLQEDLGDAGIFIDQADGTRLESSEINLVDQNEVTGVTGVGVYFTQQLCQLSSGSHRSLEILNNDIVGTDLENADNGIGLSCTRACGSGGIRDVNIVGNDISDFLSVGMYFSNCTDAQMTCNVVHGGNNGVDIVGGNSATPLRFRTNRFEAKNLGNFYGIRTNDALAVDFGPDRSDSTGLNEVVTHLSTNVKFVRELDSQAADSLDAEYNYWMIPGSSGDSLLVSSTTINPRMNPSAHSVNFDPPKTTTPGSDCDGSQFYLPGIAIAPDRFTGPGGTALISLSQPRPNPGPVSTMELVVPEDRRGQYILECFDVRGARVFARVHHVRSAGKTVLEWNGENGSGESLGNGIYFLRVQGPQGFDEIRKVVLLR